MDTDSSSLKAAESGLAGNVPPVKDDTTINGLSEGEGTTERVADGDEKQEKPPAQDVSWDWNTDPDNPYNWPAGKKWWQVAMISSFGFLA
jgi:hypothetical protein